MENKGINAKSWFYSQPGFHANAQPKAQPTRVVEQWNAERQCWESHAVPIQEVK